MINKDKIKRSIKKNIALIGARGIGKSSLSKLLAFETHLNLFSVDDLVRYENQGKSIEQLVNERGWAYFRQAEYQVLEKLKHLPTIIIDCGGGILIDTQLTSNSKQIEIFSTKKANILKKYCHIIYLKASIPTLLLKNVSNQQRPTLTDDYEKILETRLKYYKNIANFTIDMDKNDSLQALKLILKKYF